MELTKENVSKINKRSKEDIEIGLNMSNLKDYQIYDTPGVNDPKMLSDEIVFNLIDKVDIVLFITDAKKAGNKSELDFLSKCIRKRDISKFIFIINQIDTINKNEKYNIKEELIDKIALNTNELNHNLDEKVYFYSAKKVLKGLKTNDKDLLLEFGYENLISGIEVFIQQNKQNLFNEMVKRDLNIIVSESFRKIDTIINKLNNKDKEYSNSIELIKKEVYDFELQIEDSIYEFRNKFKNEKIKFKNNIKQAFESISRQIDGEISNTSIEKLSENRYIEQTTRKLIEDATNDEFIRFTKSLVSNFETLDIAIDPIFKEKNIVINDLITKTISPTIIKGLGISLGVVGAIVYTPTILTIGAVGIGMSALSSGIISTGSVALGQYGTTIVGGANIVNSAISTAAILAIQAGKLLFELANWVISTIADFAGEAEKILQLKKYKSQVLLEINKIKQIILNNIEYEFNSDIYIESFINEKFPQKEELNKRIEESNKLIKLDMKNISENKTKIEQLKTQIEGYVV